MKSCVLQNSIKASSDVISESSKKHSPLQLSLTSASGPRTELRLHINTTSSGRDVLSFSTSEASVLDAAQTYSRKRTDLSEGHEVMRINQRINKSLDPEHLQHKYNTHFSRSISLSVSLSVSISLCLSASLSVSVCFFLLSSSLCKFVSLCLSVFLSLSLSLSFYFFFVICHSFPLSVNLPPSSSACLFLSLTLTLCLSLFALTHTCNKV